MTRPANWQLGWVCAAVLLAGSTWFAGTAAAPQLARAWSLGSSELAWLTISAQLGFITGTLLFAVTNLADVFNSRAVFAVSALAGAAANLGFALASDSLWSAIAFRLLTGVTLAGVYPVAMKIIASWFRTGLGWRLGLMVGALTIGTALPYLSVGLGQSLSWRAVAATASASALAGALIMTLLVDDGPHLKGRAPFDVRAFARVFGDRRFRLSAIGYFGHMWELYAVWALVGALIAESGVTSSRSVALLSFTVVAVGAIGCAGGGWLSRRVGEVRVARIALATSALFCLASPLLTLGGPFVFMPLAILWGIAVVADSPQLSALAARNCPPAYTATALTIQNGIGFAITIGSLQLLPLLADWVGWRWVFVALAPGPIIGALALTALRDEAPITAENPV